ncbi:DUF6630 family protein [Chitinimonas sp. BJB300]|uniref:DUF6630 family protein n=1 Tax=Chitinimonas sp. BJB300 TaxID=1559339 RepID=UPI000C111A5C|nr:hypothetical protein [Chitinimonas sp. BJB300]PHV10716.1 hypothetical protein CSQ89_14685 [Chitinimonas sp. BJB300]TSJ88538.1 hypothetical protein FG002_010235 [Chitinimonas sp. BJB300]
MHSEPIQVWAEQAYRLFELINPENPERAEAQHEAFLAELAQKEEDEIVSTVELMWLVKDVIDGESGFFVSWRGKQELIEAMGQILPDPDLSIDWGTDDLEDEEFLQSVTVPELLHRAYASLLDAGYILWCWNTETDSYVGWVSLAVHESELTDVCHGLGIDVRIAEKAV